MQLLALGLNHRNAPVTVREQLALSREDVLNGLLNIVAYGAGEAVLLSTCNRTELYAAVNDAEEDEESLRRFLIDLTGADFAAEKYFSAYEGENCVRHLFSVAAGLDSLILGEGQILSQVKAAYAMAREAGTTGTVLNTLFHRAIAVGKRVRTETRIDYNSVSVSYAAVQLAKEKLGGSLKGKRALIFGAGKMAKLTAQHLSSFGTEKIFVANRHIEKAEELAETVGGQAVPFDGATENAVNADIIVTSTGAPHYVVKAWETRRLMSKRRGKPLFIVDIAVPRDVDPAVGDIKGVTLFNIDDLTNVVDEHMRERQTEAQAAKIIVEEETRATVTRFRYLSFRPLMVLLSDRAERIREREVRRASGKLPNLTADDWRQVNRMTKMIVRKILRAPMMRVNGAAGTKDGEFYAAAMRKLFRLDTVSDGVKEGFDAEETMRRYRYKKQ